MTAVQQTKFEESSPHLDFARYQEHFENVACGTSTRKDTAMEPVRGDVRHLSEFKLPVMKLTCSCGRRGEYTIAKQIEAFGDMTIADFIAIKVSAVCPLWERPQKHKSCHAGCDELMWMFRAVPGSLEWAVHTGYRNPDGTVKDEAEAKRRNK